MGGSSGGQRRPQAPLATAVQHRGPPTRPRARRCARLGLIPGSATHWPCPSASPLGYLIFAFPIENGIEKINLLKYVKYLKMPGSEQASNECHFPSI